MIPVGSGRLAGYITVEADELVLDFDPALRTRWRWRARRECRRLNAARRGLQPGLYSYRWAVMHRAGRWEVVAMQNRLERL